MDVVDQACVICLLVGLVGMCFWIPLVLIVRNV